jgi:hypothetical protein
MKDITYMTGTSLTHAPSFTCNLNAIDPAARAQHSVMTAELFHSVQAIQELPDG